LSFPALKRIFRNIVSDAPLKFPFGAKFCFSFLALFNFQGASRRFRDSLIRILQLKPKVKNFFINPQSFV
ncbi:MAG: hypothetical protein II873_01715, partial [Oscillospiraceae bacterium]|nr:hypothetical protein [Oscillospiraceae bacterium]